MPVASETAAGVAGLAAARVAAAGVEETWAEGARGKVVVVRAREAVERVTVVVVQEALVVEAASWGCRGSRAREAAVVRVALTYCTCMRTDGGVC